MCRGIPVVEISSTLQSPQTSVTSTLRDLPGVEVTSPTESLESLDSPNSTYTAHPSPHQSIETVHPSPVKPVNTLPDTTSFKESVAQETSSQQVKSTLTDYERQLLARKNYYSESEIARRSLGRE